MFLSVFPVLFLFIFSDRLSSILSLHFFFTLYFSSIKLTLQLEARFFVRFVWLFLLVSYEYLLSYWYISDALSIVLSTCILLIGGFLLSKFGIAFINTGI